MEIRTETLDDLYKLAISTVLNTGQEVTARGLTFKEQRFSHLVLENPRARLIQNPVRSISKKFLMAEFIWMMSGSPWLHEIEFYNKRMKNFSDDGIGLHGAYGPRLRHWGQPSKDLDQLESCLQRLREDIYTRQAVIIILDPGKDFTVKTKDIPCNDLLQFLYRDGKLDLCCYVRSNDLNWGFPYDVFHWTLLQEIFAVELGVELGEYHHMVGSLHIYDKDYEFMSKVAKAPIVLNEMPKLPEDTTLDIIGKLKAAEIAFRIDGEDIACVLPEWWQERFRWIMK